MMSRFPTVCLVERRASVLSTSSTGIFAIALLAGFLPGVKANCRDDSNGFENCNGLSNTARIVLAVLIPLFFLALMLGLYAHRRRRVRQANQAYIHQTQPGSEAANAGRYGTAAGPTSFAPQPPPSARGGLNNSYNYGPTMGSASQSGPPSYYPPPAGMPPVTSYKK